MTKKTVLYLVENKNTPQFRYRVANLFEACKKSKYWNIQYYTSDNIKSIYKALLNASILVIVRQTPKNRDISNLIKYAKEQNIKVFFDLDDLVFSYRYLPTLLYSTNSKNICYWLAYLMGIRKIAKQVDGFIVTNSFLANIITESFKKPAVIIPNSLNSQQIKFSEQTKGPNNKTFTLGYFSGSPTHARDFHLIEPEIVKFITKHDNVKLTIVGYMKFSLKAKKLLTTNKITHKKSVNYIKLQEEMSKVDINLAPLINNSFTNCKSELKFFESAIAKTTTIASPTFSFKNAIQDNKTGFLARPGEWYQTIDYLYRNPKKNREIAINAKNYCLKHYFGPFFLKKIEEAYDTITQYN